MNALHPQLLSRILSRPRYVVYFAKSREEIEAALRLRFEVFNLELNEGLASSYAAGLDEDEFDAVCHHLIVCEETTGAVVGTYRLQTGVMAARNLGYYSAREFDFSPFEPVRRSLVELGRACVHKDHRTIAVISLLWREIVRYAFAAGGRYLIGCSSLTSQNPALGAAMYQRLAVKHLANPAFRTSPRAEYAFSGGPFCGECPTPPKLLRAYLSVGAKICGPPAIDREFGTIDFLTLLDCRNGSAIATEHFLKRNAV